jgi:hypothetical protein
MTEFVELRDFFCFSKREKGFMIGYRSIEIYEKEMRYYESNGRKNTGMGSTAAGKRITEIERTKSKVTKRQ